LPGATVTRCWWGWGRDAEHLDAAAVAGLGTEVGRRLGAGPRHAAAAAQLSDVEVPTSAIAGPTVPGSLEELFDLDPGARVVAGHGQAFREVARAFHGAVVRVPDAVLRPRDADDVERLLAWADQAGVAVVPRGGGTSVVEGTAPPPDEPRPVVTLDLGRLDQVTNVDATSLAARVQAGVFGPALEDQLRPHRLTLRFFPQSFEFSTLGGWIVTRAGGHFATGPTHIDDLVESVDAITPTGRWSSRRLPASGAGPSPDRLLLGSEGTLGVVTSAWVRVRRRPVHRSTATLHAPTMSAAADAVRRIVQAGLQPANARVLDPVEAVLNGAGDGSHAVLVLGFESADRPQRDHLDDAVAIARDAGATISTQPRHIEGDRTATATGGAASWRSSFLAGPYLRDALISLGMVVETFETAITWDRFDAFVGQVRDAAQRAAAQVCGAALVAVRITHAYPDGAAPYFTVIAPGREGVADRVAQWDAVKAAASDAILAAGGTITHHHAVGRTHLPWWRDQVPEPHRRILQAGKAAVDPNRILNPGVLGL